MDEIRSSLEAVINGESPFVGVAASGLAAAPAAPAAPAALLPGSFNPVHEGHWRLAAAAARSLDRAVDFELSVANVDKPMLEMDEVLRRVGQFHGRATVWVTRLPTFVEKARHFPEAIFVVGLDTAERLVAARYYPAGLDSALGFIRDQRCRVLVAGRLRPSGVFEGFESLNVPEAFRDLFLPLSANEFRVDMSSTELRNKTGRGSV